MIRCAEAPCAASIITSSSISASFGRHALGGVGGRRLDEEDVGAADRLLVAAVDLAVGEGRRSTRPRSRSSLPAIRAASSIEQRPPNTIRRLV